MTRSEMMSRIKSKNTKPERVLARELRKLGLRFKQNDRLRPGRPDFSFPSKRIAVFVDGGFWHGKAKLPESNRDFWKKKLCDTILRDIRDDQALRMMGWRVLRLDEGEVTKFPALAAQKVAEALKYGADQPLRYTRSFVKDLQRSIRQAMEQEAERVMEEARQRGAHLSLMYHLTEYLVHPGKGGDPCAV